MRFEAVEADREAAHPVARRIDKIGKAHIGTVAALLYLLAQEGERHMALLVGQVDRDAVAVARARPKGERKSVGQGKRGSVRVDIGGRRYLQKKKTKEKGL